MIHELQEFISVSFPELVIPFSVSYPRRKLKEEHEKWGLAISLEKTKYVCMGEGKEILKYDGGEEIKPCTQCTYLGTKIDHSGDNTTEIKHRISQTRKAINAQKYY